MRDLQTVRELPDGRYAVAYYVWKTREQAEAFAREHTPDHPLTIEDVRRARSIGGGWYRAAGAELTFSDLQEVAEDWIAEQGGIYTYQAGEYSSMVVRIGHAPAVDPATQRPGPYGGRYPEVFQVEDRSLWGAYASTAITERLVGNPNDEPALGYGEDHGDNVRKHIAAWLR